MAHLIHFIPDDPVCKTKQGQYSTQVKVLTLQIKTVTH